MWVVKLGGSLNADALLVQWLELLATLGGGRVTIVCGGGGFADEVRRTQARWQLDELSAHNMAVLAMAQTSYLALGLEPRLRLAASESDIRQVLHAGHTALWLPFDQLFDRQNGRANWENSSDSIALELARQLNAERLVVVKSCAVDPHADLASLVAAGILDGRFESLAAGAGFPIDVIQRSELSRMRSLLLGEVRAPGG